jgi:WD40 repeat protein
MFLFLGILQHETSIASSFCIFLIRAGGHEKLLRLFDVERPEAAPIELTGAPSAIKAAVFVGPSDSLLVSSTGDTPGLTVWDVRGGAIVRSMPTDGPVTSVDVSGECDCWVDAVLCSVGRNTEMWRCT